MTGLNSISPTQTLVPSSISYGAAVLSPFALKHNKINWSQKMTSTHKDGAICWKCIHLHFGHKKFITFPKQYWPIWSDQMIKYIFQTLEKYFGQYGQPILANTKTLRFFNGHNGLTEFNCKNSDWNFFHMSKQSDHFGQKLFGRSANFTVASVVWPKWPLENSPLLTVVIGMSYHLI